MTSAFTPWGRIPLADRDGCSRPDAGMVGLGFVVVADLPSLSPSPRSFDRVLSADQESTDGVVACPEKEFPKLEKEFPRAT